MLENVEIVRRNCVVIGSGAAGLNAADRLYAFGQLQQIIPISRIIHA